MFARHLPSSFTSRAAAVSHRLCRGFAESAKKQSKDSNVKLLLTLAISGPVCYGVYSYATDMRFHELMDEKYLFHMPWVLKKMNKWFPSVVRSPFALRVLFALSFDPQRLNVPMELKEALGEAFTELDLAQGRCCECVVIGRGGHDAW